MKIGTLTFDIFGELIFKRSVEHFISAMDPVLLSISDYFDSDYRRFSFYAAVIKIDVPLKIFWQSNYLYDSLKKHLDYSFTNWTVDITLNITERGK